jgi:endogenous inhibitor of DNA gyrase (YacG/DUF329 family)
MSCPICSKPSEAKFTPFCSRRCADIDLSRWLKGSYAIPGGQAGDEDGDKPSRDAESPENSELGRANRGMDRE